MMKALNDQSNCNIYLLSICECLYVHLYIYIYIFSLLFFSLFLYIYIIHTHTHTHTHTRIWKLVSQLCPTLCYHMDYSPPGFFVHEDSPTKNTGVGWHFLLQGIFLTEESNLAPCFVGWFFTSWATREAFYLKPVFSNKSYTQEI